MPTTVGRDDGPFGIGSLQWWVDDNEEDHYFTLREHPEFHDWFGELAAFDVVANNADRKAGHVIYDGERCWAIDNGLCFHEQDKLRTVIWEYAGLDVNAHLLERIESLRERRDRSRRRVAQSHRVGARAAPRARTGRERHVPGTRRGLGLAAVSVAADLGRVREVVVVFGHAGLE